MKGRILTIPIVVVAWTLCTPWMVTAQNPELVGSFRPYLFVLLAFAAGWVLVGAWVFVIGMKVNRLARQIEEGPVD